MSATPIRIIGATVVDPQAQTAAPGDLCVADGRVSDGPLPGCATLDATGLFVLPGLIDMHVHLVPPADRAAVPTGDRLAPSRVAMRTALHAGVTTIRDLGGDLLTLLALRREQTIGAVEGSRLFVAGPALTVPHGHGMHSAHGFALGSAADAAVVVHALADAGVDQVKVVTSGARGDRQMKAAVLRAAVSAARSYGLPIAAHAHFQEPQLETSVDAGVTSIEHGFLLHRLPRLLERMAADGVFLCPTMRVVESIREEPQWYGQRLIPQAWTDVRRTVAVAHAAEVNLIAGTDSGVYGVAPGDLWREVTLIGEACGSRFEGLRAATWTAGRALGRADLGHLAPGAIADAVLTRRNPAIEAVVPSDVAAVLQEGRVVWGRLPSADRP
jgi:imidazolonepropionase-like amidohydrolase